MRVASRSKVAGAFMTAVCLLAMAGALAGCSVTVTTNSSSSTKAATASTSTATTSAASGTELSAADALAAANAELSSATNFRIGLYANSVSDENAIVDVAMSNDAKLVYAKAFGTTYWADSANVYYQKDGAWYKYAPEDASELYTAGALSLGDYAIPSSATQGSDTTFNGVPCYVYQYSSDNAEFYVSKTGHLVGVQYDIAGSKLIMTFSFDPLTMPTDVAAAQAGNKADYESNVGGMGSAATILSTSSGK